MEIPTPQMAHDGTPAVTDRLIWQVPQQEMQSCYPTRRYPASAMVSDPVAQCCQRQ
ncbi:hypothetical protein QUQ58_004839 [Escherichia coli]|nr:hypothetical protein [Escherichia coli]